MIRFIWTTVILFTCLPLFSQDTTSSLLLDLVQLRAEYNDAKHSFEGTSNLYEDNLLTRDEYQAGKSALLRAEIAYQKHLSKILINSQRILVDKAEKFFDEEGHRRVRLSFHSTREVGQELLNAMEQDFAYGDILGGTIYNLFISLTSGENSIIIGSPYEIHVPAVEPGRKMVVEFDLLKDVENLQVVFSYGGRESTKHLYLERDSRIDTAELEAAQFSQDADLGGNAAFDLTAEIAVSEEEVFHLSVLNLPRQVTYDYYDGESGVRLSQIKVDRDTTTQQLQLRVYLPERAEKLVEIDKPIEFYAALVSNESLSNVNREQIYSETEVQSLTAAWVKLALYPRGIGEAEIRAQNLYFEVTAGQPITTVVTAANTGTRDLNDLEIVVSAPLGWETDIQPAFIDRLEQGRKLNVKIALVPPADVGVGAREVKLSLKAFADNRSIEIEDKILRVQIKKELAVGMIILLALVIIGVVTGIVIFGIKITRR